MAEVSNVDKKSGKHHQDIDDNCPMTGDETDTDTMDTSVPQTKKTVQNEVLKSESFTVYRNEEEEESLSSDRNCFSDEETSSIAGSYDDFGKSEYDEDDSPFKPVSERCREEQFEQQALRHHLDQLGELVVEREYAAQQARTEFQRCKDYLEKLETESQSVEISIKEAETKGQKAVYFRLKSKRETLLSEIAMEREVKLKMQKNVEDAEFFLAQTYIEHGKFLPLNEDLNLEEKQLASSKAEKASNRIKKEMANAAALERKRKTRDREHVSAVRERERKSRQAFIAAKKNREVAMKYLKETMSRVRQRESEEEDKNRTDLNKRMNVLLSLKRNIELNKENISAAQAQSVHLKKQSAAKEKSERNEILQKGGNPDEVLIRRNQIRKFERDKEAFERKQREREIEIVNKIISEEKQMTRRYQQQQQLITETRPRRMPRKRSKPRCAPSSGSESMEYGADVEDTVSRVSHLRNKTSTDEEGEFSPYGISTRDDNNSRETTEDDGVVGEEEEEESLNEPEFQGLWNRELNKVARKNLGSDYSKYEKEMMQKALMKQKANIVQTQIAAGKEFKGNAFCSKPEVVFFKDFEVGKTYKRKVLLTNVSYSQNYCQFVGLTEALEDFLEVKFSSPGAMSAGLTCDLVVTFKPMLNNDIEGSIGMRAATGDFNIPVKCSIKRCEVSLSTNLVDFQNQVVGEVRKKLITLKNDGALAVDYNFAKVNQNITIDEKSSIEDETVITARNITGVLSAFSSVQLEVVFAPKVPSSVEAEFCVSFSIEDLDPISVKVKGVAVDLPVWVERKVVNLKICMFDRLYQDAVLISNRATTALRLRFEVPKELRNHLDLLPKTAFIQAESQFSVQLKFLPRRSILTDASCFENKHTGALEIPIVILVADQTQPVCFSVHTKLTSSDIVFNKTDLNFGYCTIYETVSHNVQMINECILSQDYGFIGTPDIISVEPNFGFGTIRPNERLDLRVTFSPKKAKDYKFDLVCKSRIGREFTLHCRGVGVFPPLQLSHYIINFKATAVLDISSTHIFVINDHLSANQFTHAVPRIGSGGIFPVGVTSFEFMPPPDAPFTISPMVGQVKPGERCMIHVTFAPKLSHYDVSKKARDLMEREKSTAVTSKQSEMDGVKDMKNKPKTQKKIAQSKSDSPDTMPAIKLNEINGKHWKQAEISLQKVYEDSYSAYKVPCFVATGDCNSQMDDNKCNVHNTLYLEVHCPSIRPLLIAVSQDNNSTVNFKKVPIGKRCTQVLALENISGDDLQLTTSILDPCGPFEIVNVLRTIKPKENSSLKIAFTPSQSKEFEDTLEVITGSSKVKVYLRGRGIEPCVVLDPPGPDIDVGDVLVSEKLCFPLKIKNASQLLMDFEISLGSLADSRHVRMQRMEGDERFSIGPSNHSGVSVFGCQPQQGKLQPGEICELTVTFCADHESSLFHDMLMFHVNEAEEFVNVRLTGRAWSTTLYARGWDDLPQHNPLFIHSTKTDTSGPSPLDHIVTLTFECCYKDESYGTAQKSVELGCIRSQVMPSKKPCEFFFEENKVSVENGVNIDIAKGTIEVGSKKIITFKWQPPPSFNPVRTLDTTLLLLMKSDIIVTYKILLQGFIMSEV